MQAVDRPIHCVLKGNILTGPGRNILHTSRGFRERHLPRNSVDQLGIWRYFPRPDDWFSLAIEGQHLVLTSDEIAMFKAQGYLGPFPMMSPDEMAAHLPDIVKITETAPDGHASRRSNLLHNRHLDQTLMMDLTSHPAIVDSMVALYGPDLLLWRTNFFVKHPGSKRIPWHQDFNYWPLEPPVICSAWIAIDPSTVENSCLQVIPGSHRKVIPHVKATDEMFFNEMGDEKYYDSQEAVDLEMKPGEFILFNERTLHHSHPNTSDKRRIGLAIRVILPFVTVLKYDSPDHVLPIIHGTDTMGFNRTSKMGKSHESH